MNNRKFVTCECVGFGHPDKLADFISDSILSEYLKHDNKTRAGIEVMVKDNVVVLGGEVTSNATIDIESIVRNCFNTIKYPSSHNLTPNSIRIINLIGKQSVEINSGVDKDDDTVGAGDQGFCVGYACNETKEFLPIGVYASRKICDELNKCGGIGPDLKSQVIVDYSNGEPFISEILVSALHSSSIVIDSIKHLVKTIINNDKTIKNHISRDTVIKVNPCGEWHIGGPISDCGITGRKIVVDHYGGYCNVGGGNLHGKDFSKVDRSGSYYARYLAKNIVAAGLAKEAKVELSFVISDCEPTRINIELVDGKVDSEKIIDYLSGLTVDCMIKKVFCTDIYNTAIVGHWNDMFPWEKTDIADDLKKLQYT